MKYFRESIVVVAETTGGVSPVGWTTAPEITLIDVALDEHDTAWAAAGHPHSVYPTNFEELLRVTSAQPMVVNFE